MSRKRILAAMSGGVDSTVAAYLLVRAGYDVVGMTAKLLPDECTGAFAQCCTAESAHAARRACDKLGIPHHTINLVDEFRADVVRRFAEGYSRGVTPNPCVDCNKHIKFDSFFRAAAALDAPAIATGHYARIARARPRRAAPRIADDGAISNDHDTKNGSMIVGESGESGHYRLMKGSDTAKDQSYFLAVIPRDRLAQILFPVGDLTKVEVREIARDMGFSNATRPESQDICFTGSRPDFAKLRADFELPPTESKSGNIIDESGTVRGKHEGIEQFTLGQRRGMRVGMQEPKYVYRIDAASGTVYVGHKEHRTIPHAKLDNCNWLAPDLLDRSDEFEWKLRYRSKSLSGRLEFADGAEYAQALLHFNEPQYFVTPGQWAVAYLGDVVVGCGEIADTALDLAAQ